MGQATESECIYEEGAGVKRSRRGKGAQSRGSAETVEACLKSDHQPLRVQL